MHRPRPPRTPFRRTQTAQAPDASRPCGTLSRLLAAVTALASAAGLTLAAPAVSASAAPVAAATSAVTQHATLAATARPAAKAATARPAGSSHAGSPHTARAARHPSDVRQVCATPKRGYAACMSLLRTNVKPRKGMFPHSTAPPGYGPSDLQSAYNLPSSSAGAGATVAVVDAYDDPNAASDLATYRAQYGLPACATANGCFEKVNQEGQQGSYPSGNSGWAVEESLDVDMVSATCPNCHIILVEANSASISDLGAAENEAVKLGAEYVSNSYGATEQALGSSESQYDQYYNHPGTVITAAGGDSGYYGDGDGANFPAASQYVTSVGGTTLKRDSNTKRGWAESVWGSSSGGEGTGSGCSLYEAKPVWQTDPGCNNRMTNDVSAVGNPNTGVALYDSYGEGGWLVVGGTSVATPITASVYALAGSPAAGSYPSSYPYLNGTGLNDVTSGANGSCQTTYFCTAATGYDGPTGLGTPDGVDAFKAVSYGTLSGTVTDSATGKPIAGATVIAGSFSGTTNSSGQYSFIAATGSYTVAVQAFGYAEKSASGVQVTAGKTVTQNFGLAAAATIPVTGTVTD